MTPHTDFNRMPFPRSPRSRPALHFPLGREFLDSDAGSLNPRAARRLWFYGGRCLVVAALACILTRPLFHARGSVLAAGRSGTPVSVTADISRRLSASNPVPVDSQEDRMQWAGMSEAQR